MSLITWCVFQMELHWLGMGEGKLQAEKYMQSKSGENNTSVTKTIVPPPKI